MTQVIEMVRGYPAGCPGRLTTHEVRTREFAAYRADLGMVETREFQARVADELAAFNETVRLLSDEKRSDQAGAARLADHARAGVPAQRGALVTVQPQSGDLLRIGGRASVQLAGDRALTLSTPPALARRRSGPVSFAPVRERRTGETARDRPATLRVDS